MFFGTQERQASEPGINQFSSGTSLSDLFGGNIGAPETSNSGDQSTQLFNLLQAVMKGGGGTANQPQPTGGTPLSELTGPVSGTNLTQLSNPFAGLIKQRFIR